MKKKKALRGRAFVKPDIDPVAVEVSYWIKREGYSNAAVARKTGLCATTIKRIRNQETGRPQITTLRFILKCYGQELVIRPKGSNQ